MPVPASRSPLVIAVSPCALFDLREDGQPVELDGQAAVAACPLIPGSAFSFVRKLLALNTGGRRQVEVVLVSADSADTGLRVLRSIGHYQLPIARAAFTRAAPCHRYAAGFGADLFLSTDHNDVQLALDHGMPAATVIEGTAADAGDDIVRIAFDGDAVLFSDEAEQVYAHSGLDAFTRSEQEARHVPLAPGPLRPFLFHLHRLQACTNARPARSARRWSPRAACLPTNAHSVRWGPGTSKSTKPCSWPGWTRDRCCAASAQTSFSMTRNATATRRPPTYPAPTCRTGSRTALCVRHSCGRPDAAHGCPGFPNNDQVLTG